MAQQVEFLLAEDPQRPSIGQYILHIAAPISLIRVLSMDDHNPVTGETLIAKHYTYDSNGYTEVFQLIAMPFTDNIVEFNRDDQETLLNVLDRAWEWYKDYITWEDSQL